MTQKKVGTKSTTTTQKVAEKKISNKKTTEKTVKKVIQEKKKNKKQKKKNEKKTTQKAAPKAQTVVKNTSKSRPVEKKTTVEIKKKTKEVLKSSIKKETPKKAPEKKVSSTTIKKTTTKSTTPEKEKKNPASSIKTKSQSTQNTQKNSISTTAKATQKVVEKKSIVGPEKNNKSLKEKEHKSHNKKEEEKKKDPFPGKVDVVLVEEKKENTHIQERIDFSFIFDAFKVEDYFTSETGPDDCLEKNCDNPVTTLGYCRYHYITNWQFIKKKQELIQERKLQVLLEDLIEKYPFKFIEGLFQDIQDEKTFFNILKEMNIEENEPFEEVFDENDDDDQDIAYETKTGVEPKVIYGEE